MTYSAKNIRLYVSDYGDGVVAGFSPANIPPAPSTVPGVTTMGGGWGSTPNATGVATDASGNVYALENGTLSWASSSGKTGTINEYFPSGTLISATPLGRVIN